ncbi:MAG: hypothetical protein FJX67_07230 [Alphaproteobacteria bacterium]|nr:hypothetical protein [Alphaproteobacteria bacterium]
MRALKFLVILMGVLIAAGLAVIVVTLVNRAGSGDKAGPGTVAVDLPPGASVVETTAADGRLYLRLRTQDGRHIILILDGATGRALGTLELKPAPTADPPR